MVRRWVNRLVPCLIVWWIGWLVFWFGSIGYCIHSSVVWCDSGSLRLSAILWSVGRLVGQSVCHSDSPRVISLVHRSIVWSCS